MLVTKHVYHQAIIDRHIWRKGLNPNKEGNYASLLGGDPEQSRFTSVAYFPITEIR